MKLSQDEAERIALGALGWIVGQDDLVGVFMGASGVSVDDLRERAQDPVFLTSVLEFLTMDDQWVIGFCDAHTLEYETPMRALTCLAGRDMTHWT